MDLKARKPMLKRSREIFTKFLKTHSIDYDANGDQIEFIRGARYVVAFNDRNTILYDDKMKTLQRGSVFEIMHYLSGSIDALV